MANWLTGPGLEHLNFLFGCSRESEGTQLSASNSKPGGGAECSRLHWLYVCLCVCAEDEKNPGRHFALVCKVFFFLFFLKRLRLFQNIYVYIHIRHFIIILITHNSHKYDIKSCQVHSKPTGGSITPKCEDKKSDKKMENAVPQRLFHVNNKKKKPSTT